MFYHIFNAAMKIVTWNINGIRASNRDIPLKKLLDSLEADIICLQETKVTRDQLDEATAIVDGYHAFFSFSKVKGGYSGVATYCKLSCTPVAAEEGLTGLLAQDSNNATVKCYGNDALPFTTEELLSLDREGRAFLSEHEVAGCKPLVIVNLYCPRADRDNKERWIYKQNFYRLVQARCEAMISSNKDVVLVGDFNVSHTKLDHCDPDTDPEFFSSNDSRIWMSQFLLPLSKFDTSNDNHFEEKTCKDEISTRCNMQLSVSVSKGSMSFAECSTQKPICDRKIFVDLFRYFYPSRENAFTCWSTVTKARKTNYGTRIDYVLANEDFVLKHALSCDIRPDIHGSDHCPVEAFFKCEIRPSNFVPDLCSIFLPEFRGKQKSIKTFLTSNSLKSTLLPQSDSNHVTHAVENSQETKEKSLMKKRSSQNLAKPPAKLQRTGSLDAENGQKSVSNLLSYFRKKPECKFERAKSESLLSFLKDAQVTDVKLQDEILREGIVHSSEQESYDGNISNSNELSSLSCWSSEVIRSEQDPTKKANPFEHKNVSNCKSHEKQHSLGKAERSKLQWKSILKGPDPPPLCEGHKEECVMRTVKKQGVNLGKQFYCCARPDGRSDDKEARCKTFIWKRK